MILHLRPVGPGEAAQAVEGVPFKGGALAVVPLFQEVAPVVVAVMTPGVVGQQVAEEVGERLGRGIGIKQVAGGVVLVAKRIIVNIRCTKYSLEAYNN